MVAKKVYWASYRGAYLQYESRTLSMTTKDFTNVLLRRANRVRLIARTVLAASLNSNGPILLRNGAAAGWCLPISMFTR